MHDRQFLSESSKQFFKNFIGKPITGRVLRATARFGPPRKGSWKCFFHELSVCKCSNNDSYKCEGKKYKTREVLKCPFHLLAYKIECYTRSKMADKLVDRVLKRGHSNWLEASHNVFIRFRPKHIYLERLHYHVSTNLGLLQANMTNEFNQQGPGYHWKIELFRRLNLPSFAGVKEMFEKLNRKRKKVLDSIKTTKAKKRRIQLRSQRTYEAQQRKQWSKKHGHHTYGEEEDTVETVQTTPKIEQHRSAMITSLTIGQSQAQMTMWTSPTMIKSKNI